MQQYLKVYYKSVGQVWGDAQFWAQSQVQNVLPL